MKQIGLTALVAGICIFIFGACNWLTKNQSPTNTATKSPPKEPSGSSASKAVLDTAPVSGMANPISVADYGDLLIRYRMAFAPASSTQISSFLTVDELLELDQYLTPQQADRFAQYQRAPSPAGLLAPGGFSVRVWEEDDHTGIRSTTRMLPWDPIQRVVHPESLRLVSPAILPSPAPDTFDYLTGFIDRGDNIVLRMHRTGTRFVLPSAASGYYECWQFDAEANSAVPLRIWVEKTSGLVVAGMGDVRVTKNQLIRFVWAMMYATQNPSLPNGGR